MFRLAVLFSALAASLVAAPAPQPKPDPKGPWFDGWDKPVDSKKDCRFDRKGRKLTIHIPGNGHKLDYVGDGGQDKLTPKSAAPMLLRDVEGDFALEVKLTGSVSPPVVGREREVFTATLVLLEGNKRLQACTYYPVNLDSAKILRIERRGDKLTERSSDDGISWRGSKSTLDVGTPKKLKVGVLASSDGADVYKAEFELVEFATSARRLE